MAWNHPHEHIDILCNGSVWAIATMKIGVLPSIIREARIEGEGEKALVNQSQHTHIVSSIEGLKQVVARRQARLRESL